MKTIKFRIYDPKEKKMVESGATPMMLHSFFQATAALHVVVKMEYQQFTGLFSKGGREIYEGDILRLPPKDSWDEKNFLAYEVFFHDNEMADNHIGFQMNRVHGQGVVSGGHIRYRMLPRHTKRMIIIGNIYENPELAGRGET